MTRSVRLAARQALLEQRSFWRSAEYALFTFAFPLMILLLIGAANVGSYLPGTHIKNTTVFVPGILAFGVIVAAYVNLGSKVAVLRHDGVLKRIKTTPLPSAAYLGGLLASTVATSVFISACTGLTGWLAFGASPRPGGLLALAAGLTLGIVCFATLGLAISSVITSADSALVMTELMARPRAAKHTMPRTSPPARVTSPPARGPAPKASQPITPVQAVMRIAVATVLASRPPR